MNGCDELTGQSIGNLWSRFGKSLPEALHSLAASGLLGEKGRGQKVCQTPLTNRDQSPQIPFGESTRPHHQPCTARLVLLQSDRSYHETEY